MRLKPHALTILEKARGFQRDCIPLVGEFEGAKPPQRGRMWIASGPLRPRVISNSTRWLLEIS